MFPTRVRFDRPNPGPYSQTAAPFHEWSTEKTPFPLAAVVEAWGLHSARAASSGTPAVNEPTAVAPEEPDDEMPF
jgi:hypothetical protein